MATETELLRQKREQLEQEIAEFASRKEDEYRSFERQYLLGVQKEDGLASPGEDTPASETLDKLRDHDQSSQDVGQSGTGNEGTALGIGDDGIVSKDCRFKSDEQRDVSSPGHDSERGVLRFSHRHERELEFQGLFTPNFLPLLGGQEKGASLQNHQGRRHSENEQPIPSTHQKASGSNQQSTASLSSSATFPSDHMRSSPSPPSARPLSASVPRQPSHHRRSSSRSDLSITSLRSSLRDPKQPRSPKRVLFSLENGVVSPSTSPIAQRSKPGQNAMQAATFKTPQPLGSFGPAALGNSSVAQSTSHITNPQLSSNPVNGLTNGKIDSKSSFRRPSGFANTTPAIAGDDLERTNGEEELFAFDEDIGSVDEDTGTTTQMEDDIGSEEDETNGQSPHAGSLPIEIKWPPRLRPQR